MAVGRQGFINNNEVYVYQETGATASAGFGIDSVDSKWKLQILPTSPPWATPSGTCQISVDPAADGHVVFTPNGIGTVDIAYLGVGAVLASATGALSSSGAGIAGQVLISNGAGVAPSWGSNSGIAWTEVTAATVNLAVDSAYVMSGVGGTGHVDATLPAIVAFGSTIIIVGKGSGLWTIKQNGGQTIHFDSMDTTIGTGSVTSINRYDSIELVCITANTDFVARTSVGNLTVV